MDCNIIFKFHRELSSSGAVAVLAKKRILSASAIPLPRIGDKVISEHSGTVVSVNHYIDKNPKEIVVIVNC